MSSQESIHTFTGNKFCEYCALENYDVTSDDGSDYYFTMQYLYLILC
jgi:hypothetical protein